MATMKFGEYAQKLFEDAGDTEMGKGPKENDGELEGYDDSTKPNNGVDVGKTSTVADAEDIELKEGDDADELEGAMVGSDNDIDYTAMNDKSKKELQEALKWWKGKSLKEQEKVAFRLFKGKKKKDEMKKKGMKRVGFKK